MYLTELYCGTEMIYDQTSTWLQARIDLSKLFPNVWDAGADLCRLPMALSTIKNKDTNRNFGKDIAFAGIRT